MGVGGVHEQQAQWCGAQWGCCRVGRYSEGDNEWEAVARPRAAGVAVHECVRTERVSVCVWVYYWSVYYKHCSPVLLRCTMCAYF